MLKSLLLTTLALGLTLSNATTNSDLQVNITKFNDWGSGFCSKVNVYNPNEAVSAWNISFNPEGVITTVWDAEYNQNSSSLETTASGQGWTTQIGSEQSITFGYCANKVEEAPVPPQEGDLTITQTQIEQWNGGYCNNVQVNNTTDHKIDWEVNVPVDGEVSTVWSANYTQDSKTLMLTADGLDWNNVIRANGQITFGYCANEIEPEPEVVEPIDKSEDMTSNIPLFSEFNIGFGGSYAFPFNSTTEGEKIWVSSVSLVLDDNIASNSYYSNIKNFDPTAFDTLHSSLKKSKFLVYWVTEGWDESWYSVSGIQAAMDAGYIPVFNYWYWGDKLMNGLPDATKQAAYKADNEKLVTFLNKLNGTKLLIMEPEFNKNVVIATESSQHEFAAIIAGAIDTIRANTSEVYFSLAMADTGSRGATDTAQTCGYENCALGDKYAWGQPSIVYNDLINKLDFISFQQMIGQFSRNPSNLGTWENPIPKAYSDQSIGIDYLATRISNLSLYLKEKYNKPVFLPYISIATATWSDSNSNESIETSELDYSGWEEKADNVYRELSLMRDELQANGLFGFAPMGLFDNPRHDYGGYQYFMQNEYHLGIIKSSAVDEVDLATNGDISSKKSIIENLFDTF
ncbi:MAG: cellulose binding domain-containing protein [Epsilonproteobacteria bacterium]|nr:cellulose binding domain-containing protein [Campylobacterota bacterium]